MKFEMKKKLVAKSERVKSVDLHHQFPWVIILKQVYIILKLPNFLFVVRNSFLKEICKKYY